jgi:hypothetical protein
MLRRLLVTLCLATLMVASRPALTSTSEPTATVVHYESGLR